MELVRIILPCITVLPLVSEVVVVVVTYKGKKDNLDKIGIFVKVQIFYTILY